MANIMDVNIIRMELRAACSDDVNKLLFEFVGTGALDVCSEEDLLKHIKAVAVKVVHKEVHRMTFNTMTQNDGETTTSYVARLKSQAFLCEFKIACPSCDTEEVSYADEMVAQRLTAGFNNQEHQRRILSEATTLVTLEQKIERLLVLETTEESSAVLHNGTTKPSEAAPIQSQYKREKNALREKNTANKTSSKCRWCGWSTHPGGKPLERAHCPAREKECNKCKTKGHFSAVCEKSKTQAAHCREDDAHDATPEGIQKIPSEASISFAFSAQDFRHGSNVTGKP